MNRSRATQAQVLLGILVAFFVISNTAGNGNTLGGIAFFIWALAAVALIGLGIKTLLDRRRGNGLT
ncbi:MAG: hypothetical protein QOE08_1884 [Thermoleophilaceae bacterium]|jgi:lipopolysaccharide export LptBFGC system permease protein LptF|nr:hypothetical protein [Thermoleophilaceae bacterium]